MTEKTKNGSFPWPFADRVAQFVPRSIKPQRMPSVPTVWSRPDNDKLARWTYAAMFGLAAIIVIYLASRP